MRKIHISKDAGEPLLNYLYNSGFKLKLIHTDSITYSAVASHADIFCCRMSAGANADVFIGDTSEIGFSYPENIKFNAVCLEKYFIHNLKYTSPALLDEVKKRRLELINVRQGYTKCNIVVVDGHSLITSDEGIFRKLSSYGDIDVLKIRQGFVRLSGFEYGFLGGSSGRVENEIIFNGNLSAHPDFNAICEFITSRGLKVRYFPEYELEDIGSIISE
ncbi:MAG: DUF6873 family GME fold protein [Acutalibacteraceae bacterium]